MKEPQAGKGMTVQHKKQPRRPAKGKGSNKAGLAARRLALEVLLASRQKGQFVNAALANGLNDCGLSERDRAFTTALVHGVIRSGDVLDQKINQLSDRPPEKILPVLRAILQLALFQLDSMPNIPPQAVLDTATELAKQHGHIGLSRFANGLLRNYVRSRDGLSAKKDHAVPEEPLAEEYLASHPHEHLAKEHSMPPWMVQRWIDNYGLPDTEKLLAYAAKLPDLCLRPCDLSITPEGLESIFERQNIPCRRGMLVPSCIIVERREKYKQNSDAARSGGVTKSTAAHELDSGENTTRASANDELSSGEDAGPAAEGELSFDEDAGSAADGDLSSGEDAGPTVDGELSPGATAVSAPARESSQRKKMRGFHGAPNKLPGYEEGLFSVQDEAAAFVSLVVDPKPGEIVIDLCAAPGGKTAHLAELMQNQGQVLAIDISEPRLKPLKELRARLGLTNISILVGDGRTIEPKLPADRILVDAPCTGTGVINRRTDLRYKRKPEDIPQLVELQRELLTHATKLVKPGGVLVYATCSIEPEENIENARWFLNNFEEFEPDDIAGYLPPRLLDECAPTSSGPACKTGLEESRIHTIQLLPSRDGISGFFIAKFKRRTS